MNKGIVSYLLLAFITGAGIFYFVGYNARHSPQYIYIKYENINHNLFKTLAECGIEPSKVQQQAVFDKLKSERKNK